MRNRLRIPISEAEGRIERLMEEGRALLADSKTITGYERWRAWTRDVERWHARGRAALATTFEAEAEADEFYEAATSGIVRNIGQSEDETLEYRAEAISNAIHTLESLRERLEYAEAPSETMPDSDEVMSRVLQALVDAQIRADELGVDQVDESLSGDEISEATGLDPRQINRGTELLETHGYVRRLRTFGTAPYDFRSASATAEGRLALERARIQNPAGRGGRRRLQHGGARRVFVVHGLNDALRMHVARVLERLDFDAVILSEQTNQGRTLIEKFEDHALDVSFAVVILSADDHGAARGATAPLQPNRARQNVILELGYFMGVLGRDRVVALYEECVELPSDIHGLVWTPVDAAMPYKLARELQAAGFEVDLNRIA